MSHPEIDPIEAERTVIENATVVTPGSSFEGSVVIEGDRIAAVESDPASGQRPDRTVDASGKLLIPGLIDIHGDDIERHRFPRGSPVDEDIAFRTVDRTNLSAGVTTKFHAIAFQDAPDDHRSAEIAIEMVESIHEADHLLADHHVHARCELTDPDCVDAVEGILEMPAVKLASVMAHIPGKGQFGSPEAFKQWYLDNRDISEERVDELIAQRTSVDQETLNDRIATIVERAREAGVALASHDDETALEVERLHDRGIEISEYPVTLAAAERATELGMTTAMGAPNLVRGGSQWGNLGTAEAIAADVVDVLCADYHPPSLLAAPFVDTGEPLHERVARVTLNPAEAVGLADRGRIDEGARADLLVVDREPTPTVERAFVAGEEVYREGAR